jgi:hypothetical protein
MKTTMIFPYRPNTSGNRFEGTLLRLGLAFLLGIATFCNAWLAEARVTRFVVQTSEPFVGGAAWGTTGAYERLQGMAFMEVDPLDPLNSSIVDLDKAPRNSRGLVEFSTPFFILKPVDMSRGNHKIYYTVNNRGNNPGALITAQTVSQVGDYDIYLRMG